MGSAFDLKNFRSKYDPAREPTLFSLFFFSLELFSVNLYLFLLFHLRNVRNTRKKEWFSTPPAKKECMRFSSKCQFSSRKYANCFSVSLNIHRTLDRLFKSEMLQWKENKRDFPLRAKDFGAILAVFIEKSKITHKRPKFRLSNALHEYSVQQKIEDCNICRYRENEGRSLHNCPQQWDILQILLFHNNHRYFSAHRRPMKPSFTCLFHSFHCGSTLW